MANNTSEIEKSNAKAQEILGKVVITDCTTLVPPSDFGLDGDVNFTCGDGKFDLSGMKKDTLKNIGHAWENNGGLHIYSTICNNNCSPCRKSNGKVWGLCTPSVAGHIQSGGVKWKNAHVGNGYKMKDLIGDSGFKEVKIPKSNIDTYAKMNVWTKSDARIGDVCIMTHGKSQNGVGHACIWNGDYWASDFIQCNALVYPNDEPYAGVKIFRYEDCENSYKSSESSQQVTEAETKATKTTTPTKKSTVQPLAMFFNVEKTSEKYCAGEFIVREGTEKGKILFQCSACIPGFLGSNCKYKGKSASRILNCTKKQVYFEMAKGYEDYTKKYSLYESSPEVGYYFKNILGLVKKGKIFLPSLKNIPYQLPVIGGKTYTNGNSFKILPGRGSVSSAGSIILGPKTKRYPYSKYSDFYFNTEETDEDASLNELIKHYLPHWNIYKIFYDLCLNTYKSIGTNIGTITVIYK